MNSKQEKILKSWRRLLWEFTQREWLSIVIWTVLGALAAGLIHLVLLDQFFKEFVVAKYLPEPKHLDDTRRYFPYTAVIVLGIAAVMAIQLMGLMARGFRSWIAGVTSGLCLLPFLSIFMMLTMGGRTVSRVLLTDAGIVAGFFILAYCLYLTGTIVAERTWNEEELRVSPPARTSVGTDLSESDDPIRTWREDALGRAALVDSISVKLMIARCPVLGLFGNFGSGKTSILNLLREHLADKAIIVSFSTWLPGSAETLTSYLLADIASECQKQYVVPGLSKGARRMADALAETVPYLKGYSEIFPAASQRDDIESMKSALARLPRRVVVLLDEIDRMERDEVLPLLKVIRGISYLPNLSFVCAADRDTLVATVKGEVNDESHRYFEKFFPVSIVVPTPDADALAKAGVERLLAAFQRRNWFEGDNEAERFRKETERLWNARIASFCKNLRAIGLLANDVSLAAALLWREVNPIDLTLIEVLRRFKPAVYEIISGNLVALTGGKGWMKDEYYTDQEKQRLEKKFLEDIQRVTSGDPQADPINSILSSLFPLYDKTSGKTFLTSGRASLGEDEKRIFNAAMFPAYFRYELPQAIFSSVELDLFIRKFTDASSGARYEVFAETLNSMEKGSPKRDDFLRKLSNAVGTMNLDAGRALAHVSMKMADRFVYDATFAGWGEAGHALRMVIRVAEKTSPSERVSLLAQCIAEASDDTMALRILTKLTGEQSDLNLGISMEQLYPGFVKRMRTRYGEDVDADNTDLSTSDPNAFNLWGLRDPADRKIQNSFWLRYIGNSRSRLAQTFEGFFLPKDIMFQSDPAPFVENKISMTDLLRLYDTLPADSTLTEGEQKSLRRLKRLLDGEFKDGIGFGMVNEE